MQLLPREVLVKTGPLDHADWNFRFPLGLVQRLRFRFALQLLPNHSPYLLEIGYGSGVFMPSLAQRTDHLHGVDVHPRGDQVMQTLSRVQVNATLLQAPAESLPYASHTFDSVVAISALEFVKDLHLVCKEIKRTLKPGGVFVVITPGHSMFVDAGLRILTGKSAKEDFGNRRQAVISILSEHFRLNKRLVFPPVVGLLVPLYLALRLVNE